MKLFAALFSKLQFIFFISILTTSSAFATGGSITFSMSSATAVPTLSGTMLIILSLLLFVVAFKITRQKNANASKFFLMLLGVGALGFGGSGIKLVSDAKAGGAIVPPITPIMTFDTPITLISGQAYHFENNSSSGQTISVISAGPDAGSICDYYSSVNPVGVLDCLAFPSLAPGEICGIGCRPLVGGPGGPMTSAKPSGINWKQPK